MSSNFQAESSKSGNEFEVAVNEELAALYDLEPDEISKVTLPDIGIELDYFLLTDEGIECGEAKGGRPDQANVQVRANRQRQKAIANGALLQASLPGTRYVVYFSAPPSLNLI